MKIRCELCPHHCGLEEGQVGLCRARQNKNGQMICQNYAKVTALSLDPIEKKPLDRFFPGSKILSVGSYGCNLCCPFCQNSTIAMADEQRAQIMFVSPQQLVDQALALAPGGSIGLAYTYNEPLVGYEYVYDCALLAREKGLKNVLVTNGYFCEEPLQKLIALIDAMNIDLKGFTEEYYQKLGGDLSTVKRFISLAAPRCHVEVTTLIVPGENDSEQEMTELSGWLASVNPEIALHVTRFFPHWKMANCSPTPVSTIYRLAQVARKQLRYVYEGNC